MEHLCLWLRCPPYPNLFISSCFNKTMKCKHCQNEIEWNENSYGRGGKPSVCADCKKAYRKNYNKIYQKTYVRVRE